LFKLNSNISTNSTGFKEKRKANLILLEEYKKKIRKLQEGGGKKAIDKHRSRGKLLARERIDLLIDPDTPFLELSAMAAYNQYDNQFPSAGIVTGIGVINGRESIIVANDATVKGGTYISETIKKHIRAQEIAMENRLPCVYMVDSGGVFLPD
jgi:acetyl-CoA carboxylase carboxyltransferase component